MALVPAVCYLHWRADSLLHTFARGAETQGEALETKDPRSWWQSSQQEIHTSNPASPPLSQKSHLLAFGKYVMVCSVRDKNEGDCTTMGKSMRRNFWGFVFILSPTLFVDFWSISSKNNVNVNKTNVLEIESSTAAACDTLVPVHIVTNESYVWFLYFWWTELRSDRSWSLQQDLTDFSSFITLAIKGTSRCCCCVSCSLLPFWYNFYVEILC